MKKNKGPTYTRYVCCSNRSCTKFESMLEAGECYNQGGRIVRNCADCKPEPIRSQAGQV